MFLKLKCWVMFLTPRRVILIQKKEKDENLNFERDVEGRNHVWVHPCTLGGSNTKIIYSVY